MRPYEWYCISTEAAFRSALVLRQRLFPVLYKHRETGSTSVPEPGTDSSACWSTVVLGERLPKCVDKVRISKAGI